MTAVWAWVRSIVLVLLVILGVELLLPRSAFRQYLRLVAGMILVLVVMEPVLAWLGGSAPPGIAGEILPRGGVAPPSRPGEEHQGGLAGRVQVAVEGQVREAFRERLAAAVRTVVLESGKVADARAEVTLDEGGFGIARVRVLVRPRSGQAMASAERESLRDLVASYLGISRQLVAVGGG
ncbi:MAG: stage III sporulation protein AF [Bacillota bacterium]|nr:stage III sporulation protein AF [Bacillota bacterium]MDI7248494.1 stage III sporulation protein AF [Bacillota bacterium]